jgi:4-carboxymuconolactone decarboxylase
LAERRPERPSTPPSEPPDTEPRADLEPPTDRGGSAAAAPIPPADESYQRGLAVRRAVLGNSHVDRALASATDFDRDFQAYITRAAWGEIWARPGLPRHTRHLITIAMLAALDRQEELGMHIRATVNTGVTQAEVREVLMQVAVYAGVPAANSAIKTAKGVFAEDVGEKGA